MFIKIQQVVFFSRCPLGLSPLDGTCVDIEDCENNPCLNGGVCREGFNGYNCTCPKNFYGQNCEIERERVVLTIGPSGIIPIVACLLLLLRKYVYMYVYVCVRMCSLRKGEPMMM